MNIFTNHAPETHEAARSAAPTELPRRRYGVSALRALIATWSERIRVRRKLEQLAKDNPHLIDDIGLTRRQVEDEVTRRFWQP